MKIRKGFVSNSSSTAFILDTRVKGVNEYLKLFHRNHVDRIGYGRGTCVAYADEVRQWTYDNLDNVYCSYHADWLLKSILRLGDNLAFVRLSDEDDWTYNNNMFVKLQDRFVHSEMEWH